MQITINNNICTSIEDVNKYASSETADFIKEFYNNLPYVTAHTSGSTGKPKEIHLLKSDMCASAELTNNFFGLSSDSTFYLNLSPSYIAGKMMIVRALVLNAKIVEESPSNQPLSNYNSNERISLGAFVPSQIKYLINNPEKLLLFDNIIIGGGKIPGRLERWLAEQGIRAFNTYGMTETCSHVALAPVGVTPQPFTAIGNITFSTDNRGCLVVNTPHFSQKKVTTNDIVNLISPTQFQWCGRIDNVINSGGIKIFPEEIEPKIAEVIRNTRFYVTSQKSDKWGEELLLILEYKSLPDGVSKSGEIRPDFINKMKQKLPSYSIPRRYIAINKFEETSSGKIIRKKYNENAAK